MDNFNELLDSLENNGGRDQPQFFTGKFWDAVDSCYLHCIPFSGYL